jgi:hypothetical protein
MARWLVNRLRAIGETLVVFGDSDDWRNQSEVPFRPLQMEGHDIEAEEIRRQAAEWPDASRIIFDVRADMEPGRMACVLGIVDRAVYFVPGAAGDTTVRRLQSLDPKLTARYTHRRLYDLAGAVEKLPNLVPGLTALLAAWPKLPNHIRAALCALVGTID